jgi:hypothetical protein
MYQQIEISYKPYNFSLPTNTQNRYTKKLYIGLFLKEQEVNIIDAYYYSHLNIDYINFIFDTMN